MLTFTGLQRGVPCIEGDKQITNSNRIHTREDEDGILFMSSTNVPGIYKYGYETKKDDRIWGHIAGYIWSSRASVINYNFKVKLLECYYRERGTQTYSCAAIDQETLESLIDADKYIIVKYQRNNDPEISYRVEEKIN